MNLEGDKVIGIVGGMGPMAGNALFSSIIRHTSAFEDQQHLSVILISLPRYIRDRTSYLETLSGDNPAYNIAEVIIKLERAGGKIIGIACNTSHTPEIYNIILQELSRLNSQVRLVNMPVETCRYIWENYPKVKRIGLMATNGTYRSGIYTNLLQEWGYEPVIPDFSIQDNVIHKMIYDPVSGIKPNAGGITEEGRSLMERALTFFEEKKADAVILGCTDLSAVITQKTAGNLVIVDSTDALAMALIREAVQERNGQGNDRRYKLVI
jgi:aspartate racemase